MNFPMLGILVLFLGLLTMFLVITAVIAAIGITGVWVLNLFGVGIAYSALNIFLVWLVYVVAVNVVKALNS